MLLSLNNLTLLLKSDTWSFGGQRKVHLDLEQNRETRLNCDQLNRLRGLSVRSQGHTHVIVDLI